jgi:hypothetical protein
LSIESSGYDAKVFGNAFAVLAGQDLRIRVVQDRGESFAEAASSLDPDNWFPLQRVIRAVGICAAPPEGLLRPDEAAQLVEKYFTDLSTGLGAKNLEQTKTTLSEIESFSLKRLMNRTQGNLKR